MKNASALTDVKVSHFRTQDQKEVDFVVEKTNGDTLGIEVKLSSSVDAKDFGGLKVLREAAGKSFKKGIVVYTGNEIVPFGDKFWAVPVCYFWE
jgi:predicted AAA+ superfamily ATPase